MKSAAPLVVASCLFLFSSFASSGSAHTADKDRHALAAIEQQWLEAQDAATLDRILAADFVHVIPADQFLTKRQHIDWVLGHPGRKGRHRKFDKLEVRLYGDAAIVNGSVVATDDAGKEQDRTMFTDVFVFRDGRWQAVNAQENAVRPEP
ncbi:MAG: nuclear transport factor 2 family protein [Acidobacteria bacterium]|nr:nuclear transport factor 2 family protein [Acidobacteriota bacterium]